MRTPLTVAAVTAIMIALTACSDKNAARISEAAGHMVNHQPEMVDSVCSLVMDDDGLDAADAARVAVIYSLAARQQELDNPAKSRLLAIKSRLSAKRAMAIDSARATAVMLEIAGESLVAEP